MQAGREVLEGVLLPEAFPSVQLVQVEQFGSVAQRAEADPHVPAEAQNPFLTAAWSKPGHGNAQGGTG